MRELRTIRDGRATVSLLVSSSCYPFVTIMKARQFKEDFSVLSIEVFQNPYITTVFDLTCIINEHLHYPART